MDLTHIVRSLVDSLDGKFFQGHLLGNDFLESTDGCIHGTIARGSILKFLACDVESNACHTLHTLASGNLQVVELHAMMVGRICTGKHEYILICHLFFLVCKLQELFV